jgi:hypothetical protein
MLGVKQKSKIKAVTSTCDPFPTLSGVAEPRIAWSFAAVAGKPHSSNQR